MNETRAARLVARLRRDVHVVRLLSNWRQVMGRARRADRVSQLRLRNGVVLDAPDAVDLWFLFVEIWIRRVYSPAGYEIHPGDTVIDIGANIGVFTTYAATRAPDVQVHAYEPYPESANWLRRNLQASALQSVAVHELGVAAAAGSRVMLVTPSNWGVNTLAPHAASANGLTVNCVSLEGLMDGNQVGRCDLLKLDCEGAEHEILGSASVATLRRVSRIVAEYHDDPGAGHSGRELCKTLEAASFRLDCFQALDVGTGLICATNLRA